MFLNAITDWIGNFVWDTIYRIFIYVIDNIVYSLIGFAYKVFLIIGNFDLFGSYTSGTEGTMEVFQTFTKRIYSVLGIVIMFILAYQIILFVIDPDKGIKESRKLITNVVKGIILTIIAPLVFHYLSIIQYHVLVSDNIIWNVVLGDHASQSDSVIEGGNTMASMLYVSVFHPIGTQYSDFYDNDGSLRHVDDACHNYVGGDISQDSVSRTLTGIGAGAVIGGLIGGPIGAGIGAAIGGIAEWMHDEANKVTACQYYYWILYQGGLAKENVIDVKPNEVGSISNYSDSKVGYSNKAHVLAPNLTLIDEIAQENNMEYYFFAPVGGIVILFFLVAYTLDIAVRAFKLAFLEMISPVPILLGTIPKNEKLYTSWRDNLIKTYIDIFVRVFVLAFIALMIKLIPSIKDALFGIFEGMSPGDAGNGMLRCVTYFVLIIGLLRAGKEIPDLIKDLAKNAGGLLNGISLNPIDSYKKSSKPVGLLGGAALGAVAGARSSFKNSDKGTRGKIHDGLSGFTRGLIHGGQAGYKYGFGRGAMTNALNESQAKVSTGISKRDAFNDRLSHGDYKGAMQFLTNGRVSKFTSAFNGDKVANNEYFSGALEFQKVMNAGKGLYSAGMDDFKHNLDTEISNSLQDSVSGSGVVFDGKFYDGTDIADISSRITESVNNSYLKTRNDVLNSAVRDSNGIETITYNGVQYTAASSSAADTNALHDRIDNLIKSDMNYDDTMNRVRNLSNTDIVNGHYEFAGKSYSGDYQTVKDEMIADKKAMVKQKEIDNMRASFGGVNGMEMLKQYALQSKDVYNQWGDTLSQEQREKISSDLSKSLNEGVKNTNFKNLLNLDSSAFGDFNAVMNRLSSADFKEQYNDFVRTASAEDKKALDKVIASTMHQVTKNQEEVYLNSKKLKELSDGVTTNRYTGQVENSISPGASKSDKK